MAFALIFILSRVVIADFRIKPDPDIIVNHWQHADLVWLHDHLFATLWNWHAQPPLWNLILGLAVKIAGPNQHAVLPVIHWFFMGLSFVAGLMLWQIFARLGAKWLAWPLALGIILSPSVAYYENYIFYPHWLMFLIVAGVWGLVTGRVLVLPVALVLASWSVALIHPLLVLLVISPVLLPRARRNLPLAALTVALSCLPIIKNQIAFGVPSASSWLGLNLAQTVMPFSALAQNNCIFLEVQHELAAKAPKDKSPPELWQGLKKTGFENMNLFDSIARSKKCQGIALTAIGKHPGWWIAGRARQLATSTGLRPFQYFFEPKGWRKLQVYQARLDNNPMATALVSWGFLTLGLIGLGLWAYRQPAGRAVLILVVAYMLIAHLFNGEEQQRMRYAIEPLFWIGLVMLARLGRVGGAQAADSRG